MLKWIVRPVIGMAGQMPRSDDLDEFWSRLSRGESLITDVPPSRWDASAAPIARAGFLNRADTFDATLNLAHKSGLTFAQFMMLTPFAGTVDFERWEKEFGADVPKVSDTPITRYWLIPADQRPKMFMPHPTMN